MPKKIDPAVRERVMRMIAEHRSEYTTPTELARVIAARERLGVETVRRWIVQAEVDGGIRRPTRPSPISSTPQPAGSTGTTTADSTDQSEWSR
jgi:transposase-like protein